MGSLWNGVECIMAVTASATCPRESVLPIRLRPDFIVVFEGYAGWAVNRPRREVARKHALGAEILRTCCLRRFSEVSVTT